jgi:hypothetical protein
MMLPFPPAPVEPDVPDPVAPVVAGVPPAPPAPANVEGALFEPLLVEHATKKKPKRATAARGAGCVRSII